MWTALWVGLHQARKKLRAHQELFSGSQFSQWINQESTGAGNSGIQANAVETTEAVSAAAKAPKGVAWRALRGNESPWALVSVENGIGPRTARGPLQGEGDPTMLLILPWEQAGRKEAGVGSSLHTDVDVKEPVYSVISILKCKAQVSPA